MAEQTLQERVEELRDRLGQMETRIRELKNQTEELLLKIKKEQAGG